MSEKDPHKSSLRTCFRAGLIGCGHMGSLYDEQSKWQGSNKAKKRGVQEALTHAGMYFLLDEFDFCCVSDSNTARMHDCQRFWKVPSAYAQYEEMIEREQLDVISVATPDESHEKIVEDVIQAKACKVLFVEKPLASSVEAGERLQKMAEEAGILLLVDYIRRWDDNVRTVREWIEDGSLGSFIKGTGYYVRGWKHNGCQLVNLLRFWLGKVKEVKNLTMFKLGSVPGDLSIDVVLDWEQGGHTVLLSMDPEEYHYSLYEVDLFFEKGRIRSHNHGFQFEKQIPVPDAQFSNFMKLEQDWREDHIANVDTLPQAMLNAGREIIRYLEGLEVGEDHLPENEAAEALEDLKIMEHGIYSKGFL